jgi:3-oxoacyl-[acyl-carrier-protein] synthase-3
MVYIRPEKPGVGIVGTGSYLPAEAVPNSVIAARTGVTEDWIVRKTGIHTRWYAAEHEATSDLAVRAADNALRAAGVAPADLGWVIVATSTPDHPQPATACLVQHRIGATRAAAFDVNAVCSGFVVALTTAAQLLSAVPSRGYALVVGADVYSRIIDRRDRRTAALFGDGAGAVVLGPVRSGSGVVGAHLASFGEHHAMIRVPAGGSRMPASEKTVQDGLHWFQMDGRGVSGFVRSEVPNAVDQLLSAHRVDAASVDHVIPHQANAVLLTEVLSGLQLTRARTHLTVAQHGNTSAASIPLALDDAQRQGAFRAGDLLLLIGFGGGMSIGAALVRWAASNDGDG